MDAGGRLHFSPPAEEVEGLRDGAPLALTHLSPLPDCAKLTLLSGGITLLGSPIGPAILRRCEGIVETAGAALSGWVSRPSAPQAPPHWCCRMRKAAAGISRFPAFCRPMRMRP